MATFILPPPSPDTFAERRWRRGPLTRDVLIDNALWFTRLRWLVVIALALLEGWIAAFAAGSARGFEVWQGVPAILAGALILGNLSFRVHLRSLRRARLSDAALLANLWVQIVLDLAVLTCVVHLVGSVETFIPFAYLFHIVLACIFFSRRDSFFVVVIAAILYIGCVGMETAGVLVPEGFLTVMLDRDAERTLPEVMTQVGLALTTWIGVWYLASRLVENVRARDREIHLAYEQLIKAGREKARHILRTTHELKAPFAAIHLNAQLLLRGSCGELSPPTRAVVEKIQARSNKLSNQILEMLQLANLRAEDGPELPRSEIALAPLLERVIRAAEAAARARRVVIEADLEPVILRGFEDQLEMMLANVVANAHLYSHEGGTVQVTLRPGPEGGAVVTVTDRGIGIKAEKLSRIFEEYYHTAEAVRHNRMSTGLGLAIVRHVAFTHRIEIEVESEPEKGTTVTLRIPAGGA